MQRKRMNITAQFYLIILALCFLLGCQKKDKQGFMSRKDLHITEDNSPFYITEHTRVPEDASLIMKPGSELVISDTTELISYGPVIIKGTKEKPAVIRGESRSPGWRWLRVKNEANRVELEHAIIKDGVLMSYNNINTLSHVLFENKNETLDWEWAVARFWYGSVRIDSCSAIGANKVEGFLLHNVQEPHVSNCTFDLIPDGVEYIDCKNGQITNNIFSNSIDDAVDLNGCEDIIIEGNTIYKYEDSGMEIGSENFGSSINIVIRNNRINRCHKGIILKESSSATITDNNISEGEIGIIVTTPDDSSQVSQMNHRAGEYIELIKNVRKDSRSIIIEI